MIQFVGALIKAGLWEWRRRVRSHVGFFFVRKKDGGLRLVVGARIPNSQHRVAPYSDLAVPAALARLLLSDEGWELGEAADVWAGSAKDVGDAASAAAASGAGDELSVLARHRIRHGPALQISHTVLAIFES